MAAPAGLQRRGTPLEVGQGSEGLEGLRCVPAMQLLLDGHRLLEGCQRLGGPLRVAAHLAQALELPPHCSTHTTRRATPVTGRLV